MQGASQSRPARVSLFLPQRDARPQPLRLQEGPPSYGTITSHFFPSGCSSSSARVELDARESLQPLATLPWRARKRDRLHTHTKDAVSTALDREASHSCLSRRLYQRENVQALVPSQHAPRRAPAADTNGRLCDAAQQVGEVTKRSRKRCQGPAAGNRRGRTGGTAPSGQLDVLGS